MNGRKLALIAVLTITLLGCGSTLPPAPNYSLGVMDAETLFSKHSQFLNNFQSTEITSKEQHLIASWPADVVFNVYFGTWCHDSEREVPKLLKILSYNDRITLNLIGLDYQKSEPNGTAKVNKVQFTPTIILTRQGVEIGRIVERPRQSLVKDIAEIIKKHSV